MSAFNRLLTKLAGELDAMSLPAGFEANLVLVKPGDPDALIMIGKSDPRDVAKGIEQTCSGPGRVGIVSSERGVELDV